MVTKKKNIKKAKLINPANVGINMAEANDKKSSTNDCSQCSGRFSTVTMFILIMLGLLGSFYYFQQILENNSRDISMQSSCGQISKMVLELNNKVTALNTNAKTPADKGMEMKAATDLNIAADKLAVVKHAYKIKKLVDSSSEYSNEQGTLKDYLRNSFVEEQSILNNQKEKVLVSDQELVSILTKNMNLPEPPNKAVGVSDKLKESVNRIVKVKKVEEKIMEQSFSNNVNMAIVKILSHEYAEAAKYVEYTTNKPVSFKEVLDTLKAKAQVKAALDRIIDKTLQEQ